MKVSEVELENFSFQYANAQWLLNKFPEASIRGPGGQLTLKT